MNITPVLNMLTVGKQFSTNNIAKASTVAIALAQSTTISDEKKSEFMKLSAFIDEKTSGPQKSALNDKLKGLVALTEQLGQLQNADKARSMSPAEALTSYMQERAKAKDTALTGEDIAGQIDAQTLATQKRLAALNNVSALFA